MYKNLFANNALQAAESLSMNGRALNDRAIEVCPSSSRVLDRAAASQPINGPPLLTPFPPSKNRPRPGDWTCPSCGFSNFQRRTACFRCSFPAINAQPDPFNAPYGVPPTPYSGHGYGHPGMMGGPHMHGGSYGGMSNMSGGSHSGSGGGGGGGGGRGGVVPFRAGDWKCGNEGCNYHNFAKNVSCLRCGGSRSNAAIIAEGNMNSFNTGGFGGPPSNFSSNSFGSVAPGEGGPYSNAAMNAPPGAFGGHSFGPPSAYGMQSGAPGHFVPGSYSGMNNGGLAGPGGFDSRAEQAFNHGSTASAAGSGGYSNGSYGNNSYNAGNDGAADSFSFLNAGMSSLGLDDGQIRRNGQVPNAAKSPQ